MKLEGTHLFDAPQELVWQMLLDPVVLAKIMPNCQALEKVGDGEYEGKIKLQVGPVQGVFQGKVTLSQLQPPDSYHMHVVGKGPAGVVDGEGDVRLEGAADAGDGGKTVMHYTGEAKVSGRIASIGQRLMDTSARAITKQSLETLEKQIEAVQHVQTAPPEPQQESNPDVVENRESETAPKSRAATPPKAAAPPVPDISPPTPLEFALSIAKELFDEFVPADKQKWVLAAFAFLLVHLYMNWWANAIARRVARRLE
jgi:carbon monoxide dehydrogenase subunit G